MNETENRNVTERHGCLVCGRIFDLLVVYAPDGRLVDCAVTSPGGRRVPEEHRPLVACLTHPEGDVEAAHKRWQARQEGRPGQEEEGE